MSGAFPSESGNPFEVRRPIKIESRATIVPSWYVRHENDGKGIVVKKGGVPLIPSFTVDRIPPERRWAVKGNGEIMDQSEFENSLERYYLEAGKAFSGNEKTAPRGNPRLNPYPRVEKYVAVEVDPRNPKQFIPIGYVAHPEKKKRTVPEQYFDSSGEPVAARPLDVLLDSYFDSRGRSRMLPHEIEAVEAHLRSQREASMKVSVKAEEPPKPKRSQGSQVAPCGKTLNTASSQALRMHQKACRNPNCAPAE